MTEKQRIVKALDHADQPGDGAAARQKSGLHGQDKVSVVMAEYKRGQLRSGSGRKVRSRKQAIAIALSEAGMSKKD